MGARDLRGGRCFSSPLVLSQHPTDKWVRLGAICFHLRPCWAHCRWAPPSSQGDTQQSQRALVSVWIPDLRSSEAVGERRACSENGSHECSAMGRQGKPANDSQRGWHLRIAQITSGGKAAGSNSEVPEMRKSSVETKWQCSARGDPPKLKLRKIYDGR